MKSFVSLLNYKLIAINALLVFLLLFESGIQLPVWLSPIGRMHPMLLHLPIGLLFLIVSLWFFRNEFSEESYQKINRFVLGITAVSAAAAALMGFFLSKEEGYSGDLLTRHKWFGVALSFFCYGLYGFYDKLAFNKNTYPILLGVGSLLVLITGHLGANLTHGEDFLFEAFKSTEKQQFTDENTLYEAVIFPILEAKCLTCHNDNKEKGELNMASIAKILKGGKNGPIWIAGDAVNSHFLQRANLPLEDEDHMPPKGKPQLTDTEILMLTAWVNSGAATNIAIKNYNDTLEVKSLAINKLINENSQSALAKTYSFKAASESAIEAVNTPFCSVKPLANGSPALEAEFFVAQRFDRKALENLKQVKEQIVSLSLAKMPITDDDLSLIAEFKNLEKLNLNGTDISGKKLAVLASLKNLTSLAVSNTNTQAADLKFINNLKNLKELFVWNTGVSESNSKELSKTYKNIHFEQGYVADASEVLQLNVPTVVNEEQVLRGETPITLKHSLPSVAIRYSLDGTEPDSVNGKIYTKPFKISEFTTLKAIATKQGWYASGVIERSFFKSNFSTSTTELLTNPSDKYKGDGVATLTDLKIGDPNNFKDNMWLGFEKNDLEMLFSFKKEEFPKELIVSYLKNIGGYIMPPTSVEVFGSNDKVSWKKLGGNSPERAKTGDLNQRLGINVPLGKTPYNYYKVVAKSLKKLPSWHQGKGQPAWLFVDEIFFN